MCILESVYKLAKLGEKGEKNMTSRVAELSEAQKKKSPNSLGNISILTNANAIITTTISELYPHLLRR